MTPPGTPQENLRRNRRNPEAHRRALKQKKSEPISLLGASSGANQPHDSVVNAFRTVSHAQISAVLPVHSHEYPRTQKLRNKKYSEIIKPVL